MLAQTSAAPPGTPQPTEDRPALRTRRRRWAELLRRVFAVEVERCPRCGGEARILGFVTEPAAITRILAHLAGRGQSRGQGKRTSESERARGAASARWDGCAPGVRGGVRSGLPRVARGRRERGAGRVEPADKAQAGEPAMECDVSAGAGPGSRA